MAELAFLSTTRYFFCRVSRRVTRVELAVVVGLLASR